MLGRYSRQALDAIVERLRQVRHFFALSYDFASQEFDVYVGYKCNSMKNNENTMHLMLVHELHISDKRV